MGMKGSDDQGPVRSRWAMHFGTSVQEWTGTAWVVVDETERADGYETRLLDPAVSPGQFIGQRVIVPCQPIGGC
jgi:hypothetical protein